jgi:hypothetical protein
VHSDAVLHCTETRFIIQGISRGKSDPSAYRHGDQRPTVLPYPEGRLLEYLHAMLARLRVAFEHRSAQVSPKIITDPGFNLNST